jgi:hypothetical protein
MDDRLCAQFDLFSMIPLDCYFSSNWHSKYLFKTMLPVFFCAVAFAVGFILKHCRGRANALSEALSAMLAFLFLNYTGIMQDSFAAFLCYEFDDGTRFLRVDYSIDCDTPYHQMMQSYASLMVLVYPFGFPVVIYLTLLSHHSTLEELRNKERKLHAKHMIDHLAALGKANRSSRRSRRQRARQ